jgi:hypothetical protein
MNNAGPKRLKPVWNWVIALLLITTGIYECLAGIHTIATRPTGAIAIPGSGRGAPMSGPEAVAIGLVSLTLGVSMVCVLARSLH